MRLLLDRLPSPIGKNFVVWDESETVRALDFEDHEARLQKLLGRYYQKFDLIRAPAPTTIRKKIEAYFNGDLLAIETIPIANNGTPFQQDAWSALRDIPPGATQSYAQQAAAIGKPHACRAIGTANGANPIAIIVPCHRVIGSTGKLIGYGGGLVRKQWLLEHERRHCR